MSQDGAAAGAPRPRAHRSAVPVPGFQTAAASGALCIAQPRRPLAPPSPQKHTPQSAARPQARPPAQRATPARRVSATGYSARVGVTHSQQCTREAVHPRRPAAVGSCSTGSGACSGVSAARPGGRRLLPAPLRTPSCVGFLPVPAPLPLPFAGSLERARLCALGAAMKLAPQQLRAPRTAPGAARLRTAAARVAARPSVQHAGAGRAGVRSVRLRLSAVAPGSGEEDDAWRRVQQEKACFAASLAQLPLMSARAPRRSKGSTTR